MITHSLDSLRRLRIMINNAIINSEVLKDFCGTLLGKQIPSNVSEDVRNKVIKAYEYTKLCIYKNADELYVNKNDADDVASYTKSIVTNVMMDIFQTGMFPETKSFMENILTDKESNPSLSEMEKFIDDYYGDLSGELCIPQDTINRYIDEYESQTD